MLVAEHSDGGATRSGYVKVTCSDTTGAFSTDGDSVQQNFYEVDVQAPCGPPPTPPKPTTTSSKPTTSTSKPTTPNPPPPNPHCNSLSSVEFVINTSASDCGLEQCDKLCMQAYYYSQSSDCSASISPVTRNPRANCSCYSAFGTSDSLTFERGDIRTVGLLWNGIPGSSELTVSVAPGCDLYYDPSPSKHSASTSRTGLIIGIVISTAVLIGMVGAGYCYCVRKRGGSEHYVDLPYEIPITTGAVVAGLTTRPVPNQIQYPDNVTIGNYDTDSNVGVQTRYESDDRLPVVAGHTCQACGAMVPQTAAFCPQCGISTAKSEIF